MWPSVKILCGKKAIQSSVFHALLLLMWFAASSSCTRSNLTELENKIKKSLKTEEGTFAVAFKDLATSETLLINAKERFHAASTMKTPVLIEIYKQAQSGKFSLGDSILVENEFYSIVDGSLYSMSIDEDSKAELYDKIGTKQAIADLANDMITASSNLATNILIGLVGAKNVTQSMRELGAPDIEVLRGVEDIKAFELGMSNTTTAYDLMVIYEKLAKGEIIDRTASYEMIDILMDQEFNDMIPAKLPQSAKVAHKTGAITGVHHDSGIVYLPDGRKYVLVLLSKELKDFEAGTEMLAGVSRMIYDYVVDSNHSDYKKAISVKGHKAEKIRIVQSEEDGSLKVMKDDRPILSYHTSEKLPPGTPDYHRRGGFIHPIYSPNGKILTDDFPKGHTHQHGLFSALVNTTYKGEKIDFWNQHDKTGTVSHARLLDMEEGHDFGKFSVELDYVSFAQGVLIKEIWKAKAYNAEPYIFDISSELRSVAGDTLFINKYHYGGMAFRGSKVWNKVDSAHFQNDVEFLTSEGKERIEANHSRPEWTAAYGTINGTHGGVAIMGHKSNLAYPEPVRIHPEMPYFCLAPMVEQGYVLRPGEMIKSKYRFVVFDGKPDIKLLGNICNDFLEND